MATNTTIPQLNTTGKIAADLGVPLRLVVRTLANCPHIRPAARAGIIRLYNSKAVEQLRAEIGQEEVSNA
jgi:hypothetical protein